MRKRILVVDDERDLARAIKLYLEAEGYDVLTAHDGVEALELLDDSENRPDLIVLNLFMPRMSGQDTLRAIRSREETLTTPVLILSAADPDSPGNAICRELADAYIQKPFDPSHLLAWIDWRLETLAPEERSDLAAWRRLRFGGELTPEVTADHISGHFGLVEFEAKAALREMGPAAVPALRELATGDDECARRTAMYLLREWGGEDAVDAFVDALDHGDRQRRWEALAALGGVATERALFAIVDHGQPVFDEVVAALSEGDEDLRRTAVYVLRRLKTPEAVRALRQHQALD